MIAVFRGLTRRTIRAGKRVVFVCGALVLMIKDAVAVDVEEVFRHARLFVGLMLTVVGLLSFASDRYCDGNASS